MSKSGYYEHRESVRTSAQPVEKLCLGLMWLAADFFNRQVDDKTVIMGLIRSK